MCLCPSSRVVGASSAGRDAFERNVDLNSVSCTASSVQRSRVCCSVFMSPCFRIPYSTACARTEPNLQEPFRIDRETLFGIGQNCETEGLKDKRFRQEEAVSVSKVRSRFHPEEKQRSACELRMWPRTKISVSLLRSSQQANVTGLRSHQEKTPGRGSVYLRHEALNSNTRRRIASTNHSFCARSSSVLTDTCRFFDLLLAFYGNVFLYSTRVHLEDLFSAIRTLSTLHLTFERQICVNISSKNACEFTQKYMHANDPS